MPTVLPARAMDDGNQRTGPNRVPAPVDRALLPSMSLLDLVQWPAMAVTLIASWLTTSESARRRSLGFWLFLASNVLWVVWAVHAKAWALIALQVGLALLNLRGARKNETS